MRIYVSLGLNDSLNELSNTTFIGNYYTDPIWWFMLFTTRSAAVDVGNLM